MRPGPRAAISAPSFWWMSCCLARDCARQQARASPLCVKVRPRRHGRYDRRLAVSLAGCPADTPPPISQRGVSVLVTPASQRRQAQGGRTVTFNGKQAGPMSGRPARSSLIVSMSVLSQAGAATAAATSAHGPVTRGTDAGAASVRTTGSSLRDWPRHPGTAPGNPPVLRRTIADPCAGLKTLRHNPRFDVIRPTPPPGRAIRHPDPRPALRARAPRTPIRHPLCRATVAPANPVVRRLARSRATARPPETAQRLR